MMIKYAIALAVLIVVAAVLSWAFVPARYLPDKPRPPPAAPAAPAFAAELLAPFSGIQQYLSRLPAVTDAAFEAVAAR
jgi:hypothetical protein